MRTKFCQITLHIKRFVYLKSGSVFLPHGVGLHIRPNAIRASSICIDVWKVTDKNRYSEIRQQKYMLQLQCAAFSDENSARYCHNCIASLLGNLS